MSSDPDSSPIPHDPPRSLWKSERWPVAAIGAATIAVQLALFYIPQLYGAEPRAMIPASLIIAGVWVATASAIFAAGPQRAICGLIRGGTVADATGVLLIVLWLGTAEVNFPAACKLYCIYASVSLCAIAIARWARTVRFRYLLAVVAATGLSLLQAGLFWLPGFLRLFPENWKASVAGWGLRANPLYGVFSAIADQAGFVWHYAEVMYRITPLGEDISVAPVYWYEPMVIHMALAAVVAAWAVLRRR